MIAAVVVDRPHLITPKQPFSREFRQHDFRQLMAAMKIHIPIPSSVPTTTPSTALCHSFGTSPHCSSGRQQTQDYKAQFSDE